MQTQQLTAGHGVLTAARTGQGRDIVMLHSLLADRHAFDPVLPALAAKHRVTLFDLPGFHGSEPVVTALLDAYVARIEDGFQEFGIDKDAIVIGNGFGGTVALAFALDHPDRVGKLVVCGAAARLPEESWDAFVAMAEKVDGVDAKARADACKVLQENDLTPLLHRLDVPTLVIGGELDEATPPALTNSLAEKIPAARYVELKGCGHCPPREQPQAFVAAIREFVGL